MAMTRAGSVEQWVPATVVSISERNGCVNVAFAEGGKPLPVRNSLLRFAVSTCDKLGVKPEDRIGESRDEQRIFPTQ